MHLPALESSSEKKYDTKKYETKNCDTKSMIQKSTMQESKIQKVLLKKYDKEKCDTSMHYTDKYFTKVWYKKVWYKSMILKVWYRSALFLIIIFLVKRFLRDNTESNNPTALKPERMIIMSLLIWSASPLIFLVGTNQLRRIKKYCSWISSFRHGLKQSNNGIVTFSTFHSNWILHPIWIHFASVTGPKFWMI